MKIRYFVLFFAVLFFLFPGPDLFASGNKEEVPEEEGPLNAEWLLCITLPDVFDLPLTRQITGDMVARTLADVLSKQKNRFRGEQESAYYRDYAWAKSRSDAARAIQSKRDERDLLLYRGYPLWKYEKNLKTIDEDIAKLEEELAVIDALVPLIEEKPAFVLSEANRNGTFPLPPAPGTEYRFCSEQKADAFVSLSLSEYFGRIYLSIKMFTLHTRSYSYEDFVLFSSEDLVAAIDEISGRLAEAVSETLPAGILVRSSPPDAMVLIDEKYAGRGDMEMQTRSPGEAEIAIQADNYIPATVPLELNPGELAELFITLTPLSLSAFQVDVPGSPGSKVFLGSLYVGETPLTLELPRTDFTYISVETKEGEIGSMIYKDDNVVRGSAQFVWENGAAPGRAVFSTKAPVSAAEKRVANARRNFYRAYGALWVILPVAIITTGIAGNYLSANDYVVSNDYFYDDPDTSQKVYDNAVTGYYATMGAYTAIGASLGLTFFHIFRYLYISSKEDATPINRTPGKNRETK